MLNYVSWIDILSCLFFRFFQGSKSAQANKTGFEAHQVHCFSEMSAFDNIYFYIAPATSQQTAANQDKMISILRGGNGVYKSVLDQNVTHVICDAEDYDRVQRSVDDSVFCSFVTPKWVFISNSLHYRLPVVGFSSVPFIHCIAELLLRPIQLFLWSCILFSKLSSPSPPDIRSPLHSSGSSGISSYFQ